LREKNVEKREAIQNAFILSQNSKSDTGGIQRPESVETDINFFNVLIPPETDTFSMLNDQTEELLGNPFINLLGPLGDVSSGLELPNFPASTRHQYIQSSLPFVIHTDDGDIVESDGVSADEDA